MTQDQTYHRTHLFTLRLWSEALGHGQSEWRGKIQHLTSGEARYFRDWSALLAFLLELLPPLDDEQGPNRSEEPDCP